MSEVRLGEYQETWPSQYAQVANELRSAAPGPDFVYGPEHELQIPDRRCFVRAQGVTPRAHLHAVVLGGPLWPQHLRFRDVLRANEDIMLAYAGLKRHLAVLLAADKAAYTEAKAPFIMRVPDALQRAAASGQGGSGGS